MSSLRHCCDVTDSKKFIGHFSTNLRRRRFVKIYCLFLNQSAMSQIRQNMLFIFRPMCEVADSSKFIGNFSTNLRRRRRRCRFVKIQRLFFKQSTKSMWRHRTSTFIGNFLTNLRCVATSQIRRNISVIFNQSASMSKICQNLSITFRPICDVAAMSQIRQYSSVIFQAICKVAATSQIR